jgi:hypothetical protein
VLRFQSEITKIGQETTMMNPPNTLARKILRLSVFLFAASILVLPPATQLAAQSSWKMLTKLVPKGFTASSLNYLGMGMAAAKDTLVVGAPFHNNYLGAVEVFTYNEAKATWSQQAELTDSAAKRYDQFGHSVAISDDGKLILVGSPYKNKSGGGISAYFLNGSTWKQTAAIAPPTDNQPGDFFGWQIVLFPSATPSAVSSAAPLAKMSDGSQQASTPYSGAIAAPGANGNTGRSYLFGTENGPAPKVVVGKGLVFHWGNSNPPPAGGYAGNKMKAYLAAINGNVFTMVLTGPGISLDTGAKYQAQLMVVPIAGDSRPPAEDEPQSFDMTRVGGVNVPTPLTAPINGLGVVTLSAPQASSSAARLVVSLQGSVYLLSYDDNAHSLTLLDTVAPPAGESTFGSALASCGNTVAVYSNDPKTATNAAVHFYSVGADNKLQDQGSVAGNGVTAMVTGTPPHPEASTVMTFSPDCNSVFVAATDLKTKIDEIDVIARS